MQLTRPSAACGLKKCAIFTSAYLRLDAFLVPSDGDMDIS